MSEELRLKKLLKSGQGLPLSPPDVRQTQMHVAAKIKALGGLEALQAKEQSWATRLIRWIKDRTTLQIALPTLAAAAGLIVSYPYIQRQNEVGIQPKTEQTPQSIASFTASPKAIESARPSEKPNSPTHLNSTPEDLHPNSELTPLSENTKSEPTPFFSFAHKKPPLAVADRLTAQEIREDLKRSILISWEIETIKNPDEKWILEYNSGENGFIKIFEFTHPNLQYSFAVDPKKWNWSKPAQFRIRATLRPDLFSPLLTQIKIEPLKPQTPTSFELLSTSSEPILKWTDPYPQNGNLIQIEISKDGSKSFNEVHSTDSQSSPYKIPFAKDSDSQIEIRALIKNGNLKSEYTSILKYVVPAPKIPTAPIDLIVEWKAQAHQAHLKWTPSTDKDIDGTLIEISNSKLGPYKEIARVTTPQNDWLSTNLESPSTAPQDVWYRVRHFDGTKISRPTEPKQLLLTYRVSGRYSIAPQFSGNLARILLSFSFKNNTTKAVILQGTVTSDASGHFVIENVPAGDWDFSLKGPTLLRKTLSSFAVHNDRLDANFTLENGDVNGDNIINQKDTDEINRLFGSLPARPYSSDPDDRADLDKSGEVDAADQDIVSLNFNHQGAP